MLVVAGAGATAICADLGARTIREEIDAMRVLGIDPIQRLVVPRVLASTIVALLLNGLVCRSDLTGGYVFSVLLQGVNPGAFINGSDRPDRLGRAGDLAEDQGPAVRRRSRAWSAATAASPSRAAPRVWETAVNETVVYAFICLFVINVIMTAIGVRVLV